MNGDKMTNKVGLQKGDKLFIPAGTSQRINTYEGWKTLTLTQDMELIVTKSDYEMIAVYPSNFDLFPVMSACEFDFLYRKSFGTVITLVNGEIVDNWTYFKKD